MKQIDSFKSIFIRLKITSPYIATKNNLVDPDMTHLSSYFA